MCVIIVNENSVKLDNEILESAATSNAHGLGVFWLDTKEITFHQSDEWEVLACNRPYIAHFRLASVGGVKDELRHPFPITGSAWLMHNGTISGLGDKERSDTQHLAEILSKCHPSVWLDIMGTYSSRFVVFNQNTGKFWVVNRRLWEEQDGCLVSKKIFRPWKPQPGFQRGLYDQNGRYARFRRFPGLEDVYDYDDDSTILEPKTTSKTEKKKDPARVNRHLIGVYGTLKMGNHNDVLLEKAHYVGEGVTVERFPLQVPNLPFVYNKPGVGKQIEVEVYSVSDKLLADLDRLEGHPNWYRRTRIDVQLDPPQDRKVSCEVYMLPADQFDGNLSTCVNSYPPLQVIR